MKVLVTGASGFIGGRLVRRLLASPDSLGTAVDSLILLDNRPDPFLERSSGGAVQLRSVVGSVADAAVLKRAVDPDVAIVFHLASVPGGATEANVDLGREVNVDGTRMLLDHLRQCAQPPIVVFASTIGVFGVPLPEVVDEETYPAPTLSYGAHKWIGEILVGDYSRRGWIDGRALRLPGIVARPPGPSGQLSAFLSDIIRELAAGREFVCPVAPEGTSWWMSVTRCIDNLLHAARMPVERGTVRRTWMLPVLHASL
ncbi:MAG: NAD-dependent epimerase/dehydratase family protein, partial [Steroidobacteraceae bacterium]|nr:NAD-dependent epimerase/dehydratase family protein [Steroidobacteraceae bacterium]